MIVVLKRGAEQDKREQLINWLKNQGLGVHISEGEYQTVLGLIGDTARVDMDLIESLSIVDSVKRVTEPFKCCNRKFHPDDFRALVLVECEQVAADGLGALGLVDGVERTLFLADKGSQCFFLFDHRHGNAPPDAFKI